MSEEKRVFSYNGVEYAVKKPTNEQHDRGNEERRRVFNDELSAGTILRDQLDEELRRRKLWSDARETRYQELRQEVIDGEFKLAKGGISLNKAKEIAIEMREKRSEMVDMLSSRTDLDNNTCEGKADAAKFNYLFTECLVYNETGERYFKEGVSDYNKNQNDPVALLGAPEFFYLLSETDGVDDRLPENKFLKKYKFANERYELVDKDGRLVDSEGRHIDAFGNYVEWQEDGTSVPVDVNGRPLDENGEFNVDHIPFLDEDGQPIDESLFEESSEEEVEEEKPKRRTRRKAKAKTEDSVEA